MDIGSIVEGYSSFMQAHPHIGNVASAEAIYFIGDVVSQAMTRKPVNWRQVGFTAVTAPIYGLSLEALMKTGDIAGQIIHDDPLTKAAAGPNLWGNVFNVWFFAHRSLGKKHDWSIADTVKAYIHGAKEFMQPEGKSRVSMIKESLAELVPKNEYIFSLVTTLTAWNAIQYANYAYIPEHMRTQVVLGTGLVWSVALSALSLKGIKRKYEASTPIERQESKKQPTT